VTPRLDHPDLAETECRFGLNVNIGREEIPPRWISAHCRQPVVNHDWQICEKHNLERDRLIRLYGEA